MEDLIINEIKNGSKVLKEIQEKLFSLGIVWSEDKSKIVKEKLSLFNGDSNIILIISNNELTWTNLRYGLNIKYMSYKKISGKKFLAE